MTVEAVYSCIFFFFNDTATTEIYTLSLHDALPISNLIQNVVTYTVVLATENEDLVLLPGMTAIVQIEVEHIDSVLKIPDRKSTRLNSSHANISYAVFCLKKKNTHSLDNPLDQNTDE